MNHDHTVDAIVQEVADAVTAAKLDQLDVIAARMIAARDEVRDFLRTIRNRPDAVFHIRVSNVRPKNPHITLSVKVHGVDAGQVKLTGAPERMFAPSNLERHFGDGWEDKDAKSLPWRDARVKRYLAAAADAVASGPLADREAAVEAATLRSIQGGEAWRYQTPVEYPDGGGGIAFSFPLPIRARGRVEPAGGSSMGYPDVLVRTGRGSSSRLRILELKGPGAGDAHAALDQAVAYAAALRLLFERGPAYRTLLGYGNFGDRVPPLEATAFVEDTPRTRDDLAAAIQRLGTAKTGLPRLRLSALFYRWEGSGSGGVEVTHELSDGSAPAADRDSSGRPEEAVEAPPSDGLLDG